MTKEQKAIQQLKYLLFIYKDDLEDKYLPTGELFNKDFEVVETVLNMLKENSAEIHQKNTELAEKNAEIEKYKKLLADNLARNLNDSIKAKEKADTDLDDLDKGWKVELEKKDKIIDLYIDELVINMFDRCCQECCRECEKDKDTLESCIKQYFERKYKSRSNRKHIRQSRIVRR